MNIEELSKTQLLWLMVLVNFVTSIATGILTVSILDVAPPSVTQTVNQIVERTVMQVATGTPIASIIPKPQPTQPSDEERLTAAVAATAARTVVIHKNATTSPALAVGTYVPGARAVVAAAGMNLPKEVVIEFADGSAAEASLSRSGATLVIYGFADDAVLPKVSTHQIVASSGLKGGQTLVSLGADGSVVTGILSKVSTDGIHQTLGTLPAGAGVVNLAGDLVGIALATPGLAASAERITTLLSESP